VEKVQTLAEFLGTIDPRCPEVLPAPSSSHKLTAKEFARGVLNTTEYRESLLRRVLLDELPPAVELWLLNTAHGKPVERVEVTDVPQDLDDLSIEQLEERALRTLEFVRRHRQEDNPADSSIH